MKRAILLSVALATVSLSFSSEILARGGRGGGRGGGGGGGGLGGSLGGGSLSSRGPGVAKISGANNIRSSYRGGYGGGSHAIGRTPSMSRPTGLPASLTKPSGGSYASRTPTPRPAYGSLPTPGLRPSTGRSPTRSVAALPSRPRPSGGARPSLGQLPSVGTVPTVRPGAGLHRPSYVDLPLGDNSFNSINLPTTMPDLSGVRLANAPLAGGAASEFLQDRPGHRIPGAGTVPSAGQIANKLPARPNGTDRPEIGARPGNVPQRLGASDLAHHRPTRIDDRRQLSDWRKDHYNQIRTLWDRYNDSDNDDWYDDDWWLLHHVDEMYETDFDHWKPAEWSGVKTWIDSDWSQPIYYAYGDNVYYQDGSVYYGDKQIATEEDYALQAESIVANTPGTKPGAEDWMPLGVFALTTDGKPSGTEPTMFLQLAVSKQGVISGTFQNTAIDSVQTVEGMVDKQTQRAAWAGVGKARPIIETGIVSLTQEFAPALVHFPDGSTQQVLLVRMKEPADMSATDATESPAALVE